MTLRTLGLHLFPLLLFSPVSAQNSDKTFRVQSFVAELLEAREIGGAVTMLAANGAVVHLDASGFHDRGAERELKTDAIFRLASMTKPIVTAAALTLLDKGLLNLDDPVSKYLPEFSNP